MKLRSKLFLAAQEGLFSPYLALRPLSGLWWIASQSKNWLYDHSCLPIHRAPSYVVSVGNLVAGGTGKTPLIHRIAMECQSKGPVAILSRGYLAKKSGLPLGDELTMLSERLPDARLFADKNRVRSAKEAIKDGAKLILLDDGFQYRKLHRDLDLVVVDAANPFGYGCFLPRGLLRDSPERLKQADAVFIHGESSQTMEMLRSHTSAPLIGIGLKLERVLDLEGREQTFLANQKVGAFCAIGRPNRFFQSVEKTGALTVHHWVLPDHEPVDLAELTAFAKKCQQMGASCLLCTEKDAVKLRSLHLRLPIPIYYLEMQIEIISGMDEWRNLIENIRLKMNN